MVWWLLKKSVSQCCVTQISCLRTNNLFSLLQRDWDYRSTADSSEYFNRVESCNPVIHAISSLSIKNTLGGLGREITVIKV